MAEPLKVGLVGLGKMGRIRARTLRENEETVLVSGTDPNPPTKGFEDLTILPDYRAVIDSGVDAVFVCAPNRYIPEVVVAALDAGKHVFCEKPPGRNMEDIERIIEAERRNPGRVLKIGFNHRYHFGIMEAKKIVESGEYGKILWLRGVYGKAVGSCKADEWRNDPAMAGGGILFDQGIHMLDLFRHFCDEFSEIKSMCAAAFWDNALEDNAFALLRNDKGLIAMLHSSLTQWKHRFTLEIFMEDGYVIVDGMPSETRSYRDEWIIEGRKNTGYGIGNPGEKSTFCNTDPSWDLELAEFVECVRTGSPVRYGTSRDAYETMRLVFGIYDADASFKRQQPVLQGTTRSGDRRKDSTPIAVTSRSFSRHPVLRNELLERYSDVRFNDEGTALKGESLAEFARGRRKLITALEPVDETVLAALPELEVISKYGVGTDMLDKAALARQGIRLGWTGGVNKRSVTELVIAFAISLLRHVPRASQDMRNGTWENRPGRCLSGRTVGIIGCGHIGKDLALILRAFGCEVLAHDILDFPEFYAAHEVRPVGLEELLESSDIVTLHVPLNESTRGILDAERLALMKPEALLINAARGGLVDESALLRMLVDGRLAGAGFDVFVDEPPDPSELFDLPNFLATPHIGGSSEEAILAMGRAAISGLDENAVPTDIGGISEESISAMVNSAIRGRDENAVPTED